MNIELRPATPANIPLLRSLAHKIWWAHYPEIIGTDQIEYMLELMYSELALRQQMTDSQVFRLIFADDEPAGYVATSQKEAGSFFLHKFYVDNTQHRRGIGAAVFQKLLAELPGLRELRLTVNRRNFKSINFYFKMDFIIEQNVDIPIGNGFVMDDFQMLFKPKTGQ
jgi:diamine N-acetyltransferase